MNDTPATTGGTKSFEITYNPQVIREDNVFYSIVLNRLDLNGLDGRGGQFNFLSSCFE